MGYCSSLFLKQAVGYSVFILRKSRIKKLHVLPAGDCVLPKDIVKSDVLPISQLFDLVTHVFEKQTIFLQVDLQTTF